MADYKQQAAKTKELVQAFASERTRENMVQLMQHIETAMVFVPVIAEGMTKEIQEAAKKNGKIELPKGTKVRNRLLVSKQGDTVFPVFTTPEEITNPELQGQFMLMPFIDCAKAATVKDSGVKAIIVNPFTDNVGIVDKLLEACVERREALDKAMKQKQMAEARPVQVTERQFHQLARTQAETLTIPKQFFAGAQAFLDNLDAKKAEVFMDAYKALYVDGIEPPFALDDIRVMVLGITADVTMARVDLPGKNLQDGMCSTLFMTYNTNTQEAHYIAVQKTKEGMEMAAFDANGKRTVIGEAPDEGTELNAVMRFLGIG